MPFFFCCCSSYLTLPSHMPIFVSAQVTFIWIVSHHFYSPSRKPCITIVLNYMKNDDYRNETKKGKKWWADWIKIEIVREEWRFEKKGWLFIALRGIWNSKNLKLHRILIELISNGIRRDYYIDDRWPFELPLSVNSTVQIVFFGCFVCVIWKPKHWRYL